MKGKGVIIFLRLKPISTLLLRLKHGTEHSQWGSKAWAWPAFPGQCWGGGTRLPSPASRPLCDWAPIRAPVHGGNTKVHSRHLQNRDRSKVIQPANFEDRLILIFFEKFRPGTNVHRGTINYCYLYHKQFIIISYTVNNLSIFLIR